MDVNVGSDISDGRYQIADGEVRSTGDVLKIAADAFSRRGRGERPRRTLRGLHEWRDCDAEPARAVGKVLNRNGR